MITAGGIIIIEIEIFTGAPLTVKQPEFVDDSYPCFEVDTVYAYVPLGSGNEIILVVDERDCPLVILTYHVELYGSPFSVNVTRYG